MRSLPARSSFREKTASNRNFIILGALFAEQREYLIRTHVIRPNALRNCDCRLIDSDRLLLDHLVVFLHLQSVLAKGKIEDSKSPPNIGKREFVADRDSAIYSRAHVSVPYFAENLGILSPANSDENKNYE